LQILSTKGQTKREREMMAIKEGGQKADKGITVCPQFLGKI